MPYIVAEEVTPPISNFGQIELETLLYSKFRAESIGDFIFTIKTTDNAAYLKL